MEDLLSEGKSVSAEGYSAMSVAAEIEGIDLVSGIVIPVSVQQQSELPEEVSMIPT